MPGSSSGCRECSESASPGRNWDDVICVLPALTDRQGRSFTEAEFQSFDPFDMAFCAPDFPPRQGPDKGCDEPGRRSATRRTDLQMRDLRRGNDTFEQPAGQPEFCRGQNLPLLWLQQRYLGRMV